MFIAALLTTVITQKNPKKENGRMNNVIFYNTTQKNTQQLKE